VQGDSSPEDITFSAGVLPVRAGPARCPGIMEMLFFFWIVIVYLALWQGTSFASLQVLSKSMLAGECRYA
jgi:hypothetical protein